MANTKSTNPDRFYEEIDQRVENAKRLLDIWKDHKTKVHEADGPTAKALVSLDLSEDDIIALTKASTMLKEAEAAYRVTWKNKFNGQKIATVYRTDVIRGHVTCGSSEEYLAHRDAIKKRFDRVDSLSGTNGDELDALCERAKDLLVDNDTRDENDFAAIINENFTNEELLKLAKHELARIATRGDI